jgi:hypothetical protein
MSMWMTLRGGGVGASVMEARRGAYYIGPVPPATSPRPWLPVSLTALLVFGGCAHTPGPREEVPAPAPVQEDPRPPAEDAPRAVLTRFLDGVEAGDWEGAWSLLSAPLRARYTPERLHEDFTREPLAGERVRRARLVVAGPVRLTATGAEFPLGPERAVRLEREAETYRVTGLE